ncbi:MAG: hypothetical protein HYX48_02905 [Chlamydiales bacterium]|nr:hypothetical protein [Chlamydiales bacterium]
MSGRPGESYAFARGLPATHLRFTSLCQTVCSKAEWATALPCTPSAFLRYGFAVRSESIGCSRQLIPRRTYVSGAGPLSRPVTGPSEESEEKSLRSLYLHLRLDAKGTRTDRCGMSRLKQPADAYRTAKLHPQESAASASTG